MKYILVTGGVISGIGKGVISSSIGTLLKGFNIQVTAIKIDPYINIDAGTFSPYEHGEVFVLDDGGEVDLDLGNYERFLDIRLHRDNNITTGKIFEKVITKERRGDYLGKTVQYIPHVTDEIQEWVESVARLPVKRFQESGDDLSPAPEVCVIELGGTIGDIESMAFVEAFRQFQHRVGPENFCNIHVSLILELKSTGEQKTKPTQRSVRESRLVGLNPDLVLCRSEHPLLADVKRKVANHCNVSQEQVISVHDVSSLYRVPKLLVEQGIIQILQKKLHLDLKLTPEHSFSRWESLAEKAESCKESVDIALVGKYTKLEDSYASVTKALRHASLFCEKKLNLTYIEGTDLEAETKTIDEERYSKAWNNLKSAKGLLVPGGFDSRGVEGMINAINYARTNDIPFLGICLGFQCAVIEFTRNILSLGDANSTEFQADTPHKVVIDMPEHNQGDLGGTMRLGLRTTVFQDDSCVSKKLYGDKSEIEERHRHRYEVNPEFVPYLEKKGLKFVGKDTEGVRMEILELPGHPYYVGVQFHPEFLSRPLRPSPPFVGLIAASCGCLNEVTQS